MMSKSERNSRLRYLIKRIKRIWMISFILFFFGFLGLATSLIWFDTSLSNKELLSQYKSINNKIRYHMIDVLTQDGSTVDDRSQIEDILQFETAWQDDRLQRRTIKAELSVLNKDPKHWELRFKRDQILSWLAHYRPGTQITEYYDLDFKDFDGIPYHSGPVVNLVTNAWHVGKYTGQFVQRKSMYPKEIPFGFRRIQGFSGYDASGLLETEWKNLFDDYRGVRKALKHPFRVLTNVTITTSSLIMAAALLLVIPIREASREFKLLRQGKPVYMPIKTWRKAQKEIARSKKQDARFKKQERKERAKEILRGEIDQAKEILRGEIDQAKEILREKEQGDA